MPAGPNKLAYSERAARKAAKNTRTKASGAATCQRRIKRSGICTTDLYRQHTDAAELTKVVSGGLFQAVYPLSMSQEDGPADPARFRPGTVLLSTILLTVGSSISVFLVGALAVSIGRDITLDNARIGFLVGAYYGAMSLGSYPGGVLVQRRGINLAVTVAAVLSLASLVIIAWFAQNWTGIAISMVLTGLAHSINQPAINVVIMETTRPGRQGLFVALKQASIPASSMLGGLSVPLIASAAGWRAAFLAAMALPLVGLLLFPFRAGSEMLPVEQRARSVRSSLDKPLVFMGLAGLLASAASGALAGFLVVTLVGRGMPEAVAGSLLALSGLAAIASRMIAGWAVDRSGSSGSSVIGLMMGVGAIGAGLLGFAPLPLAVVGVLLAYAFGWGWNGAYVYNAIQSRRDRGAAASGFAQATTSIGGGLGPIAFGWIATRAPMSQAWSVAIGWLLLASLLARASRRAEAA